jgi:pyruvate,water dikinase
MTNVVWVNDIGTEDHETVGGKGANLGEMASLSLPVPPAFVVTADAFRAYLDETGIGEDIFKLLDDLDVDDNKALHETSKKIRDLVLSTPIPDDLQETVANGYNSLSEVEGDAPLVAVRSSATAEDLPEASFAGQQDTYLNIRTVDDLVRHIQKCWASLYTPRAIFYREDNDFDHEKVAIAVVVQMMVDAEKAGVLFTKHPTTGEDQTIVEAAWGLGEGVVSGSVSPDNYVLDGDGEVVQVNITDKSTMHVRGEDDKTVVEPVPTEKRNARVLTDGELEQLERIGETVESHYGTPQDIEWCMSRDHELYILQTRPITTIQDGDEAPEEAEDETEEPESAPEPAGEDGDLVLEGLGASPGVVSGPAARIDSAQELDRVEEGDVIVTGMTTPDMVPAMRRAEGIVTDEGGLTCHAAIVSRELGIPSVVGTGEATELVDDEDVVTIDGDRGTIHEGAAEAGEAEPAAETGQPAAPTAAPEPVTATEVKVNVSMAEAVDRAVDTNPDGVGLLRIEHMVLGLGEHPLNLLRGGRREEYVDYLADEIRAVAEPFDPDPVWVRTLDAPTDEFRGMEDSEEPDEPNPMLGWRGIRRSLDQPELVEAEFEALARLHDEGLRNLGVMLPLVQHPDEVREAQRICREAGLEPGEDIDFGIMIEVPAAAVAIDDFLDVGLDFVSFGTNDLTQYGLAVDRNNGNVADLYDEFHPGVTELIRQVVEACDERDVDASICGQAGSDPDFVTQLVEWGIDSVSANIDAVPRVKRAVARAERQLLLDASRGD